MISLSAPTYHDVLALAADVQPDPCFADTFTATCPVCTDRTLVFAPLFSRVADAGVEVECGEVECSAGCYGATVADALGLGAFVDDDDYLVLRRDGDETERARELYRPAVLALHRAGMEAERAEWVAQHPDETPWWVIDVVAAVRLAGMASRILSRSALASLPEPEALIENVLDRRTTALLAGRHGTGKSFLALAWGAAVATGSGWQGREARKGRVLYVVGEGAQGIHDRLKAWESHSGMPIPDDAFHVFPGAVQLANPVQRAEMVEMVRSGSYDLVIIDTLARCAVGLDENSAKDIGVFIDALEDVKLSMDGGSVLVVHHTGKDGKTVRGSSALEAAVDTAYLADGEPKYLRLARTKRKDGPLDDVHTLVLREVEGSCVFVAPDAASEALPAERIGEAWVALRSTFGQMTASRTELVSTLKEHDFGQSTAYRMIHKLMEVDALQNVGTVKTPKLKLVDAAAEAAGLPDARELCRLPVAS